jgi:hypothetical protein
LKVPAELGYGSRGVQDVVPTNSRLIFVIELLELRKQLAKHHQTNSTTAPRPVAIALYSRLRSRSILNPTGS